MKASVIVPVYNDPRIDACLSSLLAQDYPRESYEIIVVDNNSDTAIRDAVQRFPVIYLRETTQGSYVARNRGLEAASGDVAAFIDADCIADARWLSGLVRGLTTPGVGGAGGRIRKLPARTWVAAAVNDLVGQQLAPKFLPFYPAPFVVTANAAYHMRVLRAVGGFDPHFHSGGDADLAWRVGMHGYTIITVPDAVVYHAARDSVAGYFRQYFGYAVGHTELFRKYRRSGSQGVVLHTFPISGLIATLGAALPKSIARWLFSKAEGVEVAAAALDVVKYAAMVSGHIYGATKHQSS